MRLAVGLFIFLLGGGLEAHAQAPRATIQRELRAAASETGVPYELLAGIAFLETRWSLPGKRGDGEHAPVFGVLGLRDDDWFGSSLGRAAALAGVSKATARTDLHAGIRGAALLLRELELATDAGGLGSTDLTRWKAAVLRYTGIPDGEDQELYWEDLLGVLARGYQRSGIQFAGNERLRRSLVQPRKTVLAPEPQAIDWDPSPNFTPGSIVQKYVVIHATEGSFASAVSWLKNPQAQASAHYVIRASDGYIKQLVKETDRAWHVRCWNPLAIGIEHEGFVEDPEGYTDAELQASAQLVKRIIADYQIPADDMHIFGHDFWTTARYQQTQPPDLPNCNDHTDPGIYWDWPKYFGMIEGK
jgi:hypothetical protein